MVLAIIGSFREHEEKKIDSSSTAAASGQTDSKKLQVSQSTTTFAEYDAEQKYVDDLVNARHTRAEEYLVASRDMIKMSAQRQVDLIKEYEDVFRLDIKETDLGNLRVRNIIISHTANVSASLEAKSSVKKLNGNIVEYMEIRRVKSDEKLADPVLAQPHKVNCKTKETFFFDNEQWRKYRGHPNYELADGEIPYPCRIADAQ